MEALTPLEGKTIKVNMTGYQQPLFETLGLRDAAKFLKMRPDNLAKEATAGRIPGAKPAGCWVFIKSDLVDYVRSLYAKEKPCLSRSAATYGTFTSPNRTVKSLESVLTRKTDKQRKNSTMS